MLNITQYDQKNILAELNKTNEKIKFTAEEDVDEAMSFSDCLREPTKTYRL